MDQGLDIGRRTGTVREVDIDSGLGPEEDTGSERKTSLDLRADIGVEDQTFLAPKEDTDLEHPSLLDPEEGTGPEDPKAVPEDIGLQEGQPQDLNRTAGLLRGRRDSAAAVAEEDRKGSAWVPEVGRTESHKWSEAAAVQ